MVNDSKGQSHLALTGECEVTQPPFSLKPGQWYWAGVWLEIAGKRTATFGVRQWPGYAPQYREADKKGWKVVSASSEESQAEKCPAANAIDGDPTTIWHSKYSAHRRNRPTRSSWTWACRPR